MTRPHALISGAGIAGPALAHQLTARGWRTTVVERSPALREEGQNVDIRGAARDVVRQMGIDGAVRAANTGELGMRFVRSDGRPAASFPVSTDGRTDGPTAELEILRGELSRIIYDRTRTDTDYRFGASIHDLTDHGDRVTTLLDDGSTVDSDVVVIAEGLRSQSRRFVTPAKVNDLDMYFGYLTIPRVGGDDQWWNWMHASGSRSVHLRPDNRGTTRAILTFVSGVRGLETLARADQLTILRRTFADVGGPAARVLAELDEAPMYFDAAGQFRSPTWARGRVALLGDAAHCNATFGGVGTSLAIVGAHALATELSRDRDHRDSLRAYEDRLRPTVRGLRPVRMGVLRLANPGTPAGIAALHAVARVVATPVVQRTLTALSRNHTDVTADVETPGADTATGAPSAPGRG